MPRVKKNGFLAYSKWDIIPVVCGVLHLAFIVGVFLMFDRLPLWALGVLGAVYAISISWDINGISHNFPHSISYLNGYFEHYAGNPDKPIAWGVSTYHKLYNWTWSTSALDEDARFAFVDPGGARKGRNARYPAAVCARVLRSGSASPRQAGAGFQEGRRGGSGVSVAAVASETKVSSVIGERSHSPSALASAAGETGGCAGG
jgi:hypothetical protein